MRASAKRAFSIRLAPGPFRNAKGTLPPNLLLEELGRNGEAAPELPEWVRAWHRASDGLSHDLRLEEALAA